MVSVGESHDSKKYLPCVERNNKGILLVGLKIQQIRKLSFLLSYWVLN